MKRKFKVWYKKEKRFIGDVCIDIEGDIFIYDSGVMDFYPSRDVIVLWYTGVEDWYEGDIIEYRYIFGGKEREIIKLNNLLYGCGWYHYDEYSNSNINYDSIKVVGNVFQNPRMKVYGKMAKDVWEEMSIY